MPDSLTLGDILCILFNVKTGKHEGKKYKNMKRKYRTARKIAVLICVCAAVLACVGGCQKKTQSQEPESDVVVTRGELGTNAGCTGELEEMINASCVKVSGATVTAGDLMYALDSYYYNPSENLVAYGVKVTDIDGSQLTDDKKEEIKTALSSDDIVLSFDVYSEKNIYETISDDTDLYIYGVNILGDGKDDNLASLHSLEIMDEDREYAISLPEDGVNAESKCVNYRVFTAGDLKKCKTGEKTLTMVYDTTQKEKELEETIEAEQKRLGDSFNEEDYGYVLYTEVKLKMQDGSFVDIINDGTVGSCVIKEFEAVDTGRNLQTLQVVLNDNVDMSKISSVVVDGEELKKID
mgnify:CR=1 FL=1